MASAKTSVPQTAEAMLPPMPGSCAFGSCAAGLLCQFPVRRSRTSTRGSGPGAGIGWGFGDQEMCELLGFGRTSMLFESTVHMNRPAGTEGATQLFNGPCAITIFPWEFNKPGGPG